MTLRTAPLVALMLGIVLIAMCGEAFAGRLGKDACDALRTEEAGLVTAGVRGDMAQGPEWARSNLAPERLRAIARLIEIDEQLSFRCKVLTGPVRKKGQKRPADAKAAVPALEGSTGEGKPANAAKPASAPAGTSAAVEDKPGDAAAPTTTKPTVTRLKPASEKPAAAKVVPKRRPASAAKQPPSQKPGLFFFD